MRVHRKNGSGPQRAAHSARFLAVLMAVIVTALTACGGAGSDKKEESAAAAQTQEAPEKKEEKKPYTPAVHEEGKLYVGILQQADHGALNETSRGFEDQLRELMGDKVVIDHRIADGSKAGCDEIAAQILADGDDLILAEGSGALQSASEATKDVPIVGAAVTDFIVAGGVSSVDEPGGNVSGISDLPPMETQKDALRALMDYEGTVGVVFGSGEKGARFQAELMEKYLDDDGTDWIEYRFSDEKEMRTVLEQACDECSALYLPSDNILAMNMSVVKEISIEKGVRVFTSEKYMCSEGGLATISVDYYELGVRAADMAYDALVYGTEKGRDLFSIEESEDDEEDDDRGDLGKTPIDRVKDTAAGYYNPVVADALGWVPTGEYAPLEVEDSAQDGKNGDPAEENGEDS